MHFNIHVIGADPVERITAAMQFYIDEDPNPYGLDWAGIGGRYTGTLIPLPGATTGVVYGDTLPQTEAELARIASEAGGNLKRMGAQQGPGVDQIAIRDLDVEATTRAGYLLDADNQMHDIALTPKESGLLMALQYGLAKDVSDDEMDALESKLDAWKQRWHELIAAADPDALITVVDGHN